MDYAISNKEKVIARINNIIDKFKNAILIKEIIYNWQDIVLFRCGLKNIIKVNFKSGQSVFVNNKTQYSKLWKSKPAIQALINYYNIRYKTDIKLGEYLSFFYLKNKVKIYYKNYIDIAQILSLIKENFIDEQYKLLSVSNSYVLDIGANIGDSALYFAFNNAKHVYALEPFPFSFMNCKKNITLNKFDRKVTCMCAGIGGSNKSLIIRNSFRSADSSGLVHFKSGRKVSIYTLDALLRKLSLDSCILKLDCEGAEYGAILNSNTKTLRKFKQIFIEYHYGYRSLVKKLRASNFSIKYTQPVKVHNLNAKDPNMYIGKIYAVRQD